MHFFVCQVAKILGGCFHTRGSLNVFMPQVVFWELRNLDNQIFATLNPYYCSGSTDCRWLFK